MAGIKFDITGDNKNFLNALKGSERGVQNSINAIERSGQSLQNTFGQITNSISGGFSTIAKGMLGISALIEGGSFLSKIIDELGTYNKAMKEVSTLSAEITNNLASYKKEVLGLCSQIGVVPTETANALYQIVSAGQQGADAMHVLEVSAKGAIGGVTETATAADAITTILNAYKMSADDAERISDNLFQTVKLGKTTFGELGHTIAQVAPLAASFEIPIEEVLALVATLTKQGTPTATAMTQVRSAIASVASAMGETAFQGRSLQETLQAVAEKYDGSFIAMKEGLHRIDAVNAVLGATGKNAAGAMQDLDDLRNSIGAAGEAYDKMANTKGIATTKLVNNITNSLAPLGDTLSSMTKDLANFFNAGFDNGAIDACLSSLEAFIAAYAVYKGLLISTQAIQRVSTVGNYEAEMAALSGLLPLKEAEAQTDLEIAVAEGRLTPEKAELVAAMRAEAAARLEVLKTQAAQATADFNEATTLAANISLRLEAAEAEVAAAEEKYAAAVASGNATAIETAELELNTAACNQNAVAKELQAARTASATALEKSKAATTALDTAQTVINTTAQGANATSTGLLTSAKLALDKAIKAVNASFLASPIFWIGAAIAAVTYGIYKLVTAETAEEAARRKANEAMDEYNNKCQERADKTNQLLNTIRSETASELEKAKAYNELATLVPTLTEKYTQQQLAAKELNDVSHELNETLEDAKYDELSQKAEKYRKTIEHLKNNAPSWQAYAGGGAGGDLAYNMAVNAHNKQIKEQEEALKLVNAQLKEYDDLRKKIAEESRPIEIRIAEAENNKETYEEIVKYYEDMQLAAERYAQNSNSVVVDAAAVCEEEMDALIADLQQKVDDAKAEQEANPLLINPKLEGWEKCLQDLKDQKQSWKDNGHLNLSFMASINFSYAQKQLAEWNTKLTALTSQTVEGGAQTFEQVFSSAQKRYNDAAKALANINKNKSKYTQEEYVKAKNELAAAKKAYEEVGGDTSSSKSSKAKQKAQQKKKEQEQAIKDAEKLAETKRKLELKRRRAEVDMEFDTRQAKIDAQVDSTAKTLEQLKLDFDQQQEELRRGYEDLKQEKIDGLRALFEADPKNKGKKFTYDEKDVAYTDAERENLKEKQKASLEEYLRSVRETLSAERESMLSYLQQYGSFQQRKLAIAKEYNDKIAKETNEWQKKQLAKERDQSIQDANAESLLDRVNFETIFSDYGVILSAPLQETLDALKKYTESSAFKSRSIEDQKSIYKAISDAKKQLEGVQAMSFSEVGRSLYEYNDALMEYNITAENLGRLAQNVIDTEEALRKAEEDVANAVDETARGVANANLLLAKSNAASARGEYNAGETRFNTAQSRLAETQNQASQSLEQFTESVERVGSIARSIASGSMKQLWEALGRKTQTKITEFLSGTASFHKAIDELTKKLTDKGLSLGKFVSSIQDVATQIAQASDEIDKGEIGKKIQEMLEDVLGKDGKGLDQLGDKITKIIDKALSKEDSDAETVGQEVGEAVAKVLQTTSSSGSLWGLIIGLIFDLLDVLAEGIGNLVDVILTKVGDAVAGILSEIGSGKFFVNIAEGIGNVIAGVVKGVANLFSGGLAFGGSNEDDMNEIIEEMAIANEALAKSIDSLTATLKDNDNTNAQSIDAYQKALQAEKEREANQRKAMNAEASKWTNSGYGFLGLGGKHSFNANAPGGGWYGWGKFNEVLRKNGYAGNITGAESIWKLSPEEMKLLRDFAPAEWAELFKTDGHGNPLNLANEYIEMADKQNELLDALNEQLTGYSWSGFKESYVSLLKDLNSDTEDFADSLEELITNALINAFINSEAIQGKIKALYAKIAQFASTDSEGGTELTQKELDELRSDNEALTKEMLAWREAAIKAGLIKGGSDYSQEASSKGFASMSQDTAQELNGRFTALQIAGESVANSVASMLAQFSVVMSSISANNTTVEEIRNLMISSNSYLEDVAKYSKKIYLEFAGKLDDMIDNIKKI